MAIRVISHVDLDAFYVAVEQARDPSLRGKPVIVGGDPNGRGVVATASYEARAYGVGSAMPLSTAKRLCPHAIFLRGDYREYERVSRLFHGILRDYTPIVEPGGIDEAYLDLTGCEPVIEQRSGARIAGSGPFEGARVAAQEIRRRVRDELQITASVGIATGRSLAKIASDAAKPDGLLEVQPGTEAAFLAPRPLRDLPGLGPKAQHGLERMGVRTLGQLAAMPPTVMRALFGEWGPDLVRRAAGIDPTPIAGERDVPKSISREGTYAHDVTEVDVLRASLRAYAESVCAELRRIERRARCVTLKLRYGDFTTITRSRTLDRPAHADEEVYLTAAELLDAALSHDARAVRLIGLGVSQLVADEVQLGLFDERALSSEALLGTIDRLRAKYGNRIVQTGRTAFDPYGEDGGLERRTGLSSQIGLKRSEVEDE